MDMVFYLLFMALVLFFLEIFAPGGILALIGGILIVVAAVMAYAPYGLFSSVMIILGGSLVGLLFFFIEIKLLARTPLAKVLFHQGRQTQQAKQEGTPEMIGKRGNTLTTLAPSGRVSIEGKTFDATSLGGLIKKGSAIEVVRIETYNLIVKEL